jgi:hypothetical protein
VKVAASERLVNTKSTADVLFSLATLPIHPWQRAPFIPDDFRGVKRFIACVAFPGKHEQRRRNV